MKACITFDTRYGNTERIARSLETGLNEAGIQTACVNAKDLVVESLEDYDLICIGAPTEGFTASKSMKEFLGKLKGVDLSGKYCFAFDTKASPGIFGSAAKFIKKDLEKQGLLIITPNESAMVFTGGSTSSAKLKEGEEKRFEKIGKQVGAVLRMSGEKISA